MILALLDCDGHHLILDVNEVLQELLQCMLLEEEDVTLLVCLPPLDPTFVKHARVLLPLEKA